MKLIKYTALLSTLALLSSVCALARDNNQHSVQIPDSVQVGSAQLQPGNYKVEWQGTGPEVQVKFLRDGKTVATVPGTFCCTSGRMMFCARSPIAPSDVSVLSNTR